MPAKIPIVGRRLIGVMPVVILRRGDQPLEGSEVDPDVGMQELGVPAVEQGVGQQRPGREPQKHRRRGDDRRLQDLIKRMHAVARDPVELLA